MARFTWPEMLKLTACAAIGTANALEIATASAFLFINIPLQELLFVCLNFPPIITSEALREAPR